MRIFARFFHFKRAICDVFVRFVAIVHEEFSHVCYIVTSSHCHNKGVEECREPSATAVSDLPALHFPLIAADIVLLLS